MPFKTYQLPEGKRVRVYKSGDKHYEGATLTVNPMQVRTLDHFLSHVTEKVRFYKHNSKKYQLV